MFKFFGSSRAPRRESLSNVVATGSSIAAVSELGAAKDELDLGRTRISGEVAVLISRDHVFVEAIVAVGTTRMSSSELTTASNVVLFGRGDTDFIRRRFWS
jgi:hypothetical protein